MCRALVSYELLFVDDGSTDDSVAEALALAEEWPSVRVVALAGTSARKRRCWRATTMRRPGLGGP